MCFSTPFTLNLTGQRVAAGVLAATAAYVGLWAQLAARSFYDSFPLPSHPWISPEGVYDEHLTRDVGGLYLALLAITAWAVVRPSTDLLRAAGVGWLVFGVPHLLFHLDHLDGLTRTDQIGNAVSLGATVVLAALLLPRARVDGRAAA